MRRPGHRVRRLRNERRRDCRRARSQGSGRREGAEVRRHHRALGRVVVDTRHVAGEIMGHPRGPGSRPHLPSARGGQQLRCRARGRLHRARPEGGRLLHHEDRGAVRHAVGLSRLPRGGAGWDAGRSLDGGASVRRARAGRQHQESRSGAARVDRLRHDARLGEGDRALHARDPLCDSRPSTSRSGFRSTSCRCCATGAA